jgi:hypothetical protein
VKEYNFLFPDACEMQTVQRKEKIKTTFRKEEFEGGGKYAPVIR